MVFRENEQGDRCSSPEGAAMRRASFRRRREYQTCFGAIDDFGEAQKWGCVWDWGAVVASVDRGRCPRSIPTGGCRDGARGRGASKVSPYRPGLVFLGQALLTFFVIVVIPARLAYEVLIIRPEVGEIGSERAGSNHEYLPWVRSSGVVLHGIREFPVSMGQLVQGMDGHVGGDGDRYNGEASARRSSRRSGSRVLMQAEEGDSFTYIARTQFYLCAEASVGLNKARLNKTVTTEFFSDDSQVEEDSVDITESETAEFCTDSDRDEWFVTVTNEGNEVKSAAVISAEQMEIVRSGNFIDALVASFSSSEALVSASDFSYESLGYVILFDEDQSSAAGLGSEFQSVLGPDQWWPWWAWLLVALGLLVLCPCAICIYMYRSRYSNPPSPSGSGREGLSGGKFGRRTGGSGSGSDKGGGNGEMGKDYYPEFSEGFNEKEFDNATAVSMDSPSDYSSRDPIRYEGDDVPRGNLVDVQTRQDQGSAWPATQAAATLSEVPSEADIAAGMDAPSTSADLSAAADESPPAPLTPADVASPAGQEHSFAKALSGRSLGGAAAALGGEDDEESSLASTAAVLGSSFRPRSILPSITGGEKYNDEENPDEEGDDEIDSVAPALARALPSAATASDPEPDPDDSYQSSSGKSSGAAERERHGAGRPRNLSGAGTDRFDEMRDLTEEERQVRMQESDAARAASERRGSSFRVSLHPDLKRKIAVPEQERRREAARQVDKKFAPGLYSAPSPPPAAPSSGSMSGGAEGGPDGDIERATERSPVDGSAASSSDSTSPSGSTAPSAAGKMLNSVGRMFGMGPEAPATVPEDPEEEVPGEEETEQPGVVEAAVGAVTGAAAAVAAWTFGDSAQDQGAGAGPVAGGDEFKEGASPPPQPQPQPLVMGAGAAAAAGGSRDGNGNDDSDSPRDLRPEEVEAYSANVDRTLEELPGVEEGEGDGERAMPMSELLARADMGARGGRPHEMQAQGSSPPSGPVASAPAREASPTTAAAAHGLDLARLIQNMEAGSLEQIDESLTSPIVATPPALLRPGVGAAARGANSRGRGLLNRPSASGSYVSSRSTSITEDNPALTEDDMSSDAQTSRTSSYLAGGSSFEEGLAQAQAASGHFHGAVPQGSGTGGGAHGITGGGGSHGGGSGGGGGGPGNGAQVSSLAEHLARAEETVGREHEKGLLYRQGPEGVAAAVAGEELPVRGAGMEGAVGGGGGGGGMEGKGEEKIESLADMLKRADDGPGNLKETFRMLDEMEARRLEGLNAAASAEGADDETKARWRGSLAELMLKADRMGNLREILDLPSEGEEGESVTSERATRQTSARSDSTSGSGAPWRPNARPE